MRDSVGVFFSIVFIIVALAVLVFGKDVKLRGWIVLGLCLLSFATLNRERVTEFVLSTKEMKVKMRQIESKLSDIAKAMETLVIAQQIDELGENNSMLLDYEPVPQSVRIIVGSITHFPRKEYGYKLEGRKIFIIHDSALKQINSFMPRAGVTVEYLRRIQTD